MQLNLHDSVPLRAYSHGGGGTREGEVPRLPIRKKVSLHMQPRGTWVRFKTLSRGH